MINRFLHWHDQVNDIAMKLNRANLLFFKIRNYIKVKTLKNIYFAIFNSDLFLYCLGSSSEESTTNSEFKGHLFRSRPLFSKNNILKFGDKIILKDQPFVNTAINRQVSPIYYDWFTF